MNAATDDGRPFRAAPALKIGKAYVHVVFVVVHVGHHGHDARELAILGERLRGEDAVYHVRAVDMR